MRRRRLAFTLLVLLLVVAVIAVLIALLLPARRVTREMPRQKTCVNNLKDISVALHNYQMENGAFPPAYTVDEEGNRLHSWRTLILPHLGSEELAALFETIDLTKPWDDAANAKAREVVVELYHCPSSTHEKGLTTYLGVVGPEYFFSGPIPRTVPEVKDGMSYTLMVVDVQPDQAVHWMSPDDVGGEELLSPEAFISMQHPGAINTIFGDGSVRSLTSELDQDQLRAMLTIAGGELLDECAAGIREPPAGSTN